MVNLKRHYSIQQVEYCRNLISRRGFPIHKLFERSCDIGLLRMLPDKIGVSTATVEPICEPETDGTVQVGRWQRFTVTSCQKLNQVDRFLDGPCGPLEFTMVHRGAVR